MDNLYGQWTSRYYLHRFNDKKILDQFPSQHRVMNILACIHEVYTLYACIRLAIYNKFESRSFGQLGTLDRFSQVFLYIQGWGCESKESSLVFRIIKPSTSPGVHLTLHTAIYHTSRAGKVFLLLSPKKCACFHYLLTLNLPVCCTRSFTIIPCSCST